MSMCLISYGIFGQQKDISLSFDINDFEFNTNNGILYVTPLKTYSFFKSQNAEPALPWIIVKVLIGADQDLTEFSYSRDESLLKSDVLLGYNPKTLSTNDIKQSQPQSAVQIKYSNISYPEDFVTFQDTHIVDGYKYLCFCVSPFRYDARSRNLYINHFQIHMSLASKGRISKKSKAGTQFRDMVLSEMVNSNEIQQLYTLPSRDMVTPIVESIAGTEDYEYLIITSNSLLNTFNDLADWKTKRGVRTIVLSVNDIYQHYPIEQVYQHHDYNTLRCMQIKKAIKDYYENHNTKYILLGGDVTHVPSLNCDIVGPYNVKLNDFHQTTTPTDYYYSALHDINWDIYDMGHNAVQNDHNSINLDPNIFVSRVSVETSTEASNYIERLISYERDGLSDSLLINMLMCGNTLYYMHNGMKDAEYLADTVYNTFIAPYSGVIRDKFFDVYNSYNYYFDTLNANNLQTALEDNHHFIDLNMHANEYNLDAGYDYYTVTHAAAFHNPLKTFITTASCNTNSIDSPDPCLSEVIMRNPNSGIMGYLGCSRQGWTYDAPYALGSSEKYSGMFYNLLFDYINHSSCVHFGQLALYAKDFLLNSLDILPEAYWLLLGINPLGDTEMMVQDNTGWYDFTLEEGNNQVQINFNDSILTIHVPEDCCRITVFSKEDFGYSYYAQVDSVMTASFIPPLVPCTVSITCYGFKPFFYDINEPLFIQNKTFSGNVNIKASEVYIGSNVTTNKPAGPVSVQSGNTKITVGRNLTIRNDFEVKQGATFSIEVE